MSSYARYIESDYGPNLLDYAPALKDAVSGLIDLARSGRADDQTLYRIAKGLDSTADSGRAVKKEYYMKPFVHGNGVVRYVDMNGHGEIVIYPEPNGLYTIKGPEDLIGIVGGRGMLSTFIQNLDDGNFFHNHGKK